MSNFESLELAGVPLIIRPPANPLASAPLIVLWHGFRVPNSPQMLAEILPLEGVQAWKAYLGLPLFGQRLSCYFRKSQPGRCSCSWIKLQKL